jgi:hypothetical protein
MGQGWCARCQPHKDVVNRAVVGEGLTSPRDVMAGAPMRTPPGVMADTSPTTAFLLSVMCARSHTLSILLPVTPCGREPHHKSSRLHNISLQHLVGCRHLQATKQPPCRSSTLTITTTHCQVSLRVSGYLR